MSKPPTIYTECNFQGKTYPLSFNTQLPRLNNFSLEIPGYFGIATVVTLTDSARGNHTFVNKSLTTSKQDCLTFDHPIVSGTISQAYYEAMSPLKEHFFTIQQNNLFWLLISILIIAFGVYLVYKKNKSTV